MQTTLLSVLLLVCLSSLSALGYDARYGPFPTNQTPQRFLITEAKPQDRPRVRVVQTTEHHIDVALLDDRDRLIAGPWRIAEEVAGNDTGTVYRADFNRDGKLDYLVQVGLGGCGLASGYHKLAFLLSGKSGYKATVVTTLFPGPEDFIDLRRDGSCQFIQTTFIHGYTIPDGRSRNYWVYSLLAFAGDELRLANHLLPDFPRWIWYSFRENHRPASDLSADQRQRLWEVHRAVQEIKVIKPLPL